MNEMESIERKKILKVGIYLRLSDEDRNKTNKEDASESIKNQRHLLLEEITKRENFLLVDEYCDEDLSGAGTYRPEFERLIKDCEDRKIDIVLCKSQSRFSRDMEIIEKYLHNKFIEWGVRFISLADNADTENKGNKKSRQINGLVNEWYLEDVSNNIRSAFSAKMREGEFISPFASYGYDVSSVDNNRLVVDPIAASVIKDIFNLYITGMGFTGIAKYLNHKNIPSPSLHKYLKGIKLNVISSRPREEIKWSTGAVKRILTNELYLGHLIQGKRTTVSYKNHKIKRKDKSVWITVKNTHEAIIDEETFNKVQMLMKERSKSMKSFYVHIFSGKTFCFLCKRTMRKKNSSRHEYLVCSNNRDGYSDCINKRAIRYDELENIVIDAINKKIEKYYDAKELSNYDYSSNNRFDLKIKTLEMNLENVIKELNKTKNYLKCLYEDKVNGIISIEQFKSLLGDYNKNENMYNKQIISINDEIEYYKSKEESLKNNDKIFSKYQRFTKLNKIIIDEFIDKIYIGKLNQETKERDILIKWNF